MYILWVLLILIIVRYDLQQIRWGLSNFKSETVKITNKW
jgi:hypothetical protein